jgi:uncharacterized repeat protein (TIGR02543 family)
MNDNVITFYYQETVYSLKYQIIGLSGCATLSIQSENVSAVTGKPNGSIPTISAGYHFVGWYLDAACTQEVDPAWVDEDTLRLLPQTDTIWLGNVTYYAKVDPDFTTLTVKVDGTLDIDENQSFVFRIQGKSDDTKDVDITVTVTGNDSVKIKNLRIGEYTVTQVTTWSYRYQADEESKTIALSVNEAQNVVLFTQFRTVDKWLDGQYVWTERIE